MYQKSGIEFFAVKSRSLTPQAPNVGLDRVVVEIRNVLFPIARCLIPLGHR
jgi:hypothetical protein